MESAARRRGGGIFEGLYKVVMRRNSVYVTFVIAGAFLGERAVDYGVHKLWERNNVGVINLLYSMFNLSLMLWCMYCHIQLVFHNNNHKQTLSH
ncbi:cytochrome b-c1 complex subunit 9 isoform X1 [Abrus precatorius]|uniref:Complex III subunit 9 n=1 Tax=Abrus precatorius TaxID=3816 RepID=A0A8B8L018_ABRPR|nr:cytochrome b-c1 complex subunit 9 isoform X1 [Abrus precatorius]